MVQSPLVVVNLSKLRGQAYDGAGNMSGPTKGMTAIVATEYPLAIYCHCLNLVVLVFET